MENIKLPSNRSFGFVFAALFFLIGIYPIIYSEELRIWSLIIATLFLFLGAINSKILNPLNFLWFKFGMYLGKIISPLIMGIIFFLVVTPIGLLMKMSALAENCGRKTVQHMIAYNIENENVKIRRKNEEYNIH